MSTQEDSQYDTPQDTGPSETGPAKRKRTRVRITLTVAAVCAGCVLVGGLAGYAVARRMARSDSADAAPQADVKTWYCSMHPHITSPKPGKCSICFMDLIPMPEEPEVGPRRLRMSPAAMALADIQTTPVRRQYVTRKVRMVGKVDYDETRVADITAWVAGRLDRLYVDYTGVTVRKGDHLVWMYSPDLIVAQRELLQTWKAYQRLSSARDKEMVARNLKTTEDKLRLWGLLDEQIEEVKQRGTPSDHLTIYAPAGGIVIIKHANEGAYVRTGTRIYTIADLSRVWLRLDAYESDVPWVRYGQEVELTTESYPGETFKGRIVFIDPVLNEKTRTVKVRVNVPNDDLRLKPGMFVTAVVHSRLAAGGRVFDASLAGKWISLMHPEVIKDGPGKCDVCGMDLVPAEELGYVIPETRAEPPLVVPASAPLVTGKRAVVYVRVDPLRFEDGHVLDWEGLVAGLRQQGGSDRPTPAGRIWDRLSTQLREEIGQLGSPPVVQPPLKRRLLAALSALLDRRDFYDAETWGRVELPEEIKGVNKISMSKHTEREVELVNRRLIESAFPDEILPAIDRPVFEGREVLLGFRAGDHYLVRHGLREGERVVTRGNFKIDSALQIKAEPSMMNPQGGALAAVHHHGDAPEGAAAKDSGEGKHGAAKLAVPAAFRAAIGPLLEAYLATAGALAVDDLAGAQRAAGAVPEAATAVQIDALDADARKQWRQLSDRAVFAAYEIRDARDLTTARRHFSGLSAAVVSLTRQFGNALPEPLVHLRCSMAFDGRGAEWVQIGRQTRNPYFGSAMLRCGEVKHTFASQAPLSVPPAFRRQLAPVYGTYLKLQQALADDRMAESQAAWQAMRAAVEQVPADGLDGRAAAAWQKMRARLLEGLAADAAGFAKIDAFRAPFEPVARAMLQLAGAFGHAGSGPLYEAFCPMAFGNKGAPWLQAGSKVFNPYFGHKMLHCGSIRRTFPATPAAGAGEGQP